MNNATATSLSNFRGQTAVIGRTRLVRCCPGRRQTVLMDPSQVLARDSRTAHRRHHSSTRRQCCPSADSRTRCSTYHSCRRNPDSTPAQLYITTTMHVSYQTQTGCKVDWIEQRFTSPPTQYRLYGRRFLQVKRPNQQHQSTEETYSTQKNQTYNEQT